MKKAYVKPELYFENFELSSSIATGCGNAINHQIGACKKGLGDFADFVFIDNCQVNPDQAGLCYHNPTDATNLFTS